MSTAKLYHIYNQGQCNKLAYGYRSVIALPPGTKWITLIDWSTLEVQKLAVKEWERMKPTEQPLPPKRAKHIKGAMKKRLQYHEKTATIKEALAAL